MNRQTVLLLALAGVLVVALWWLFLFSPGQDELAQLEEDTAAAESEQVSLQTRVAALEAVRARAPETEAAIARLESIVPAEPALPGALRQVEAAADDAGVRIRAFTAERPTALDELSLLHEIPFTLNVEGSYFQIVDFLRRIEDPTVTSRGVTFSDITMTPTDYPTLVAALSGELYAALDPVPTPQGAEDGGTADAAATPAPDADATESEEAA